MYHEIRPENLSTVDHDTKRIDIVVDIDSFDIDYLDDKLDEIRRVIQLVQDKGKNISDRIADLKRRIGNDTIVDTELDSMTKELDEVLSNQKNIERIRDHIIKQIEFIRDIPKN